MTIQDCPCGNRCEGRTQFCASCNAAQRKAERQANKVKIVVPVKKITAKRAAETVNYLKLKRQYLEAYPCCEVEGCHLKSVDVHHQSGRQNEHLTDVNDFMAVCRFHHEEFTEHSRKAIEEGYSKLRTTK